MRCQPRRVGLGARHPPRVGGLIAEAFRAEDEASIPLVLGLLDDDSQLHEAIFGVGHAVESFAPERYSPRWRTV